MTHTRKRELTCANITSVASNKNYRGYPLETSAVRGACPVWTFCDKSGGGSSNGKQFLVQTTLDFSKFMVCPSGHAGLSQFSRFCTDVFYGRPHINKIGNISILWKQ